MAKFLWGKVFYLSTFAGVLQQEAGNRYVFRYDESYLNGLNPPIAHTLPLQTEPFISEERLPAFFDNLVAEGWLEQAQARLLGKRLSTRFELLLAFGRDCAGAVSIIDPEKVVFYPEKIDASDAKHLAVLRNRASLSGIQAKLFICQQNKIFKLADDSQLSTHIAKLPSESIVDIVYNEWFTTQACQALLPTDQFVDMHIAEIPEISEQALIIKRFDRNADGEKLHFEEFNQLLNLSAIEKYDGAYADMAAFINHQKNCLPAENYILFKRILAGIITGNTDMHFKNFAMMHTQDGLRLSPNYDQVAGAIYEPYQYIALKLNQVADRIIGQLKPKHIIALGHEFKLNDQSIIMAVSEIEQRLVAAKDALTAASVGHSPMKNKIINFMEKRWNGSFSSIGRHLLRKQ